MSRWQGWLVSLSAALLAVVLAGPPLWSAVSATIQHREDTAHISGDLGTMFLCVRNDAATVLAGATLRYIPCTTDATGAIRTAGSTVSFLTPNGDSMVDDTAGVDALKVTLMTAATTIGLPATFVTYHFTGAQALKIVDHGSPGQKVQVLYLGGACGTDVTITGGVTIRFQFGTSTTPLAENAAGVTKEPYARILPAGGNFDFQPHSLVEGIADDNLYLHTSATTGGKCYVSVGYRLAG